MKDMVRLHFLKKEMNTSRTRQVMGFDEAKKVGVLFDASSPESYQQSLQFIKSLEAEGKKVMSMGYVSHKKTNEYLLEQLNAGLFRSADFTWNYKVSNARLQDFYNTSFDILIDLTPGNLFHTKFIAALSGAFYKVGVFQDANVEIFDLMISLPEPFRLKELMQHTVFYLKMIKKPVSNVG